MFQGHLLARIFVSHFTSKKRCWAEDNLFITLVTKEVERQHCGELTRRTDSKLLCLPWRNVIDTLSTDKFDKFLRRIGELTS